MFYQVVSKHSGMFKNFPFIPFPISQLNRHTINCFSVSLLISTAMQILSLPFDFCCWKSKRIEIGRDTATNLPVLAECNWRFSVVEVDNSIVPNNSPKLKPLIGATRELLLFTIASIGADQSEDWIVGSFWGQRNCCHPLPH